MPILPTDLANVLEEQLEIHHYIALGSAPGTSLGETHLLLHTQGWQVFVRRAHGRVLEDVPLRGGASPELNHDPFGARLCLPTVQGDEWIPLTPGEVVPLQQMLLRATEPESPPATEGLKQPDSTEAPGEQKNTKLAHRLFSQMGQVTEDLTKGSLEATVDRALNVIEFVAQRAARRDHLSSLKVTANVNLMVGQVAIEVGYRGAELKKMIQQEGSRSQDGQTPEGAPSPGQA